MSIFYGLIAKYPDIVLSEYSDYHGNFMQIIRILLRKIPKKDSLLEMSYDNYILSFISDNYLTYLCLTENFPSNLIYFFLSDLKFKIYKKYNINEIKDMNAYQLTSFNSEINYVINHYINSPRFTLSGEEITEDIGIKIIKKDVDEFISKSNKINLIILKNDENYINLNNSNLLYENSNKRITILNFPSENQQRFQMFIACLIVFFLIYIYYII